MTFLLRKEYAYRLYVYDMYAITTLPVSDEMSLLHLVGRNTASSLLHNHGMT